MRHGGRVRGAIVRWVGVLLLVAVCAGGGFGQSGRKPPPKPSGDQQGVEGDVQLRTEEVLLAVSVRDPEGRPARGLTQDDFIIAENRVRQKIESFSVASVPVNVVVLLDASGSVFSELASIRKAAGKFVDALGSDDKISVIQFADKVELLQDWTTNHDDVRQALNWRFRGGQVTKYWDAVYLAAEDQLSKVEGRRAIILLTDGVDTASKVGEGEARAALDRSGATVFVVSKAEVQIQRLKPYAGQGGSVIGTAPQARFGIEILEAAQEKLRAMADRYGGRMFAPLNDADLTSAYGEVAVELKQQYVITYVPQNENHDGSWRAVDVFLTRPGLVARTRKGYVAQ